MISIRTKREIPLTSLDISDDYIDIWLRYDTHYGHKEYYSNEYNLYCRWLNNDSNRFDIWGGDQCEFAVPTIEKFKYLPSQEIPPEMQWDHYVSQLGTNSNKHLIVLLGNHEMGRIIKTNHFYDPIKKECDINGINYSRINTYFILEINDQRYIFYLSHGRSGAQTPDYILKQLIWKGIGSEADFVIVGHSHHNYSTEYYRNCINGNKEIIRSITGLRPGSFLPDPEYVAMGTPRPSPIGNQILRVYTNEPGYTIYRNIDEWLINNAH